LCENYEKKTVGKAAFRKVYWIWLKVYRSFENEKNYFIKKSGQKIVVIGALANDKVIH
jgi:beta-glucosidase